MNNDRLAKYAVGARRGAYAPYSKFKVGAAVETADGRIYTGCNVENASYGLAICAERVALFKAVSDGARRVRRIAIATGADRFTPPCGACRQVLAEFNPKLEIILVNKSGRERRRNLHRLLPDAFLPRNIK